METTNSEEPKQKSVSQKRPFWPETIYGKTSLSLLVASFILNYALVNVVQIPFQRLIMLLGVLVFSCLAKFHSKDKSIAVIVTLILGILGISFWVLFLLGEVLIGHE